MKKDTTDPYLIQAELESELSIMLSKIETDIEIAIVRKMKPPFCNNILISVESIIAKHKSEFLRPVREIIINYSRIYDTSKQTRTYTLRKENSLESAILVLSPYQSSIITRIFKKSPLIDKATFLWTCATLLQKKGSRALSKKLGLFWKRVKKYKLVF